MRVKGSSTRDYSASKIQIQADEYYIPYHWQYKRGLELLYNLRTELALGMIEQPVHLESILDFGCGDGKFTSQLVQAGVQEVVGVDISFQALQHANRLVSDAQFVLPDNSTLPFNDTRFDAVFCLDVIEHIPDNQVDMWMAELLRVLKSGGKMVVSVPSTLKSDDPKHFRHYSPEHLEAFLTRFLTGCEMKGYLRLPPLLPEPFLCLGINAPIVWRILSIFVAECPVSNGLYLIASGHKG